MSGFLERRCLDQREHDLVAVGRPGRRGGGSTLRILEDLPEAASIRLHDPDRALRLGRATREDDLLAVGRPPGRRADVESGWGDAMQARTVHVHHVQRPGGRISSRLGPEKDDLRTVWGEVHGYVVIGISRQAGETPSIRHSDDVDTIAIRVGVVPAFQRHLLSVRRPGTHTEVQGRVAKWDLLQMRPV